MKKLLLTLALITPTLSAQQSITWRFDDVAKIGGNATTIVGAPKVVTTDLGKAIHFQGDSKSGDAIFLPTLPLTGALDYSFEVIFRPSAGGQTERVVALDPQLRAAERPGQIGQWLDGRGVRRVAAAGKFREGHRRAWIDRARSPDPRS